MFPADPMNADSAMKRVPFVDRRDVLSRIQARMIAGGTAPVFLITAAGGQGKTELIKEVLRRCSQNEIPGGPWCVADEAIDFYHLDTHSVEGLMAAIARTLNPGPQYLLNFRRRLTEYHAHKWELAGLPGELSRLRQEMSDALIQDVNLVADRRPVVLAFDTLERLLYEPDEVQAIIGVDAKQAGVGALPWLLKEFVPKTKEIALLLAARPEPETPKLLLDELAAATGERLVPIQLQHFEKTDAAEYWQVAIDTAKADGRHETADRLASIDAETQEIVWICTGGRPILLSLVMDYVIRTNALWEIFKQPVSEIRALTEAKLDEIRKGLEGQLVREFQERGLPVDPAARMLGWARRGLSVELLATMLDTSAGEAAQLHQALATMAFVKRRPGDERLFVHDEMERLLWEHLQRYDYVGQQRALSKILAYYERQVALARQELTENLENAPAETDIHAARAVSAEPSRAEQRRQLRSRLYTLMAEQVYYALRHNPMEGFRLYYRYVKECYWAGADEAAMEMRDELLLFNREFDRWVVGDDAGLTQNDIICEAALRWLDRASKLGDYTTVASMAGRIRTNPALASAFEAAGSLPSAELDLLEGRARIFAGDRVALAQKKLEEARDKAERFRGKDKDDFGTWRGLMLLAESLNDLGYAARVQGRLLESIRLYNAATLRWREIGPEAKPHYANTLNNLSWALAERGSYFDALRRCGDALEMRLLLGQDGPVAFSLNTMGLIETYNDQPHRGRAHCERALKIFHDLAQPRGIGLASVALAESLRRMALTPYMYDIAQQADLLRAAVGLAEEAVAIFTAEIPERGRMLEALIELGCDYREWARIRKHRLYPSRQDLEYDDLIDRSKSALNAAVTEGSGQLPHKVIDARVNLAWLCYYTDRDEQARELISQVVSTAEVQPYLIREGKGLPTETLEQPVFFMQLGKANLLQGRLDMRVYNQVAKDNARIWRRWRATGCSEEQKPDLELRALSEAAEGFTLALAYDGLYARDFRDLRRGHEALYKDLKGFNLDLDFPEFVKAMEVARVKFKLSRPTELQQFVAQTFGSLEQLGMIRT